MIDEKMDRLEKHLHPPFVVEVVLQRNTHHLHGEILTCRMNVTQSKRVLHAEREGALAIDAIDETLAAIKQQLEKQHRSAN